MSEMKSIAMELEERIERLEQIAGDMIDLLGQLHQELGLRRLGDDSGPVYPLWVELQKARDALRSTDAPQQTETPDT